MKIEYLVPYLPYVLICNIHRYSEVRGGQNQVLISLINGKHGGFTYSNYLLDEFKPILIPLKSFNKWIIKDIKEFLEVDHNQCMEFLGFCDGEIQLKNISLGLHDAMCKKHIDFNRLIEKGLAIDKNTLNEIH